MLCIPNWFKIVRKVALRRQTVSVCNLKIKISKFITLEFCIPVSISRWEVRVIYLLSAYHKMERVHFDSCLNFSICHLQWNKENRSEQWENNLKWTQEYVERIALKELTPSWWAVYIIICKSFSIYCCGYWGQVLECLQMLGYLLH